MIITIESDVAEVQVELNKTMEEIEASLPDALAQVAEFGLSRWTDIAQERLMGDSAQEYLTNVGSYYSRDKGKGRDVNEGLIPRVELDRGNITAKLALIGKLSNMLENGFDAYDIAEAIRRKQGKDDVNVPFRHFLPTAERAEQVGKVSKARRGAGITSKAQHRRPSMSHRVRADMRSSIRIAEAAGKATARGRKYPPKQGSGHKTGIFSGMKAPTKLGGRSQGVGWYQTFRRITKESVWIHPGFMGIKAAESVQTEVENVGPQMLAEFIGTVLEVKIKSRHE